MDRSQKAESVAQLNAVFNEVGVVVVTRNLGLSVKQSTDLRTKMRDAGATYKVAKNRLAKLALKDTQYEGLEEHLTGPTALAWSTDPIAAAKAAVEFAKTNDRLEIVGLVNAPATKVAQLVNAPAAKLARVFGAYGAKEAA